MNSIPILVLGAGELGMPVLRNLVRRIDSSSRTTITVLLRHSSINPSALSKQRDVNELRSLGVHFLAGDLAQGRDAALTSAHVEQGCRPHLIGKARGA